ncbi:MAG: hypothetical protein H7144_00520 [Burkholderiales bacterium]|nr:hypothetical protein [Phycisphaerae bacterium]
MTKGNCTNDIVAHPVRRVRRLAIPLAITACALVTAAMVAVWWRSQTVADMIGVPVGRAGALRLTTADGGVRVAFDLAPIDRPEWIVMRGPTFAVYPFVRLPEDRLRRTVGVDCQWLTNPGAASEAAVVFPIAFVIAVPAMVAVARIARRRRRSSGSGFPID